MHRALDGGGLFTYARRRDGCGWHDERIDSVLFEAGMKFRRELLASFAGGEVSDVCVFRARLQTAADVLTVFLGASGKPTCLLVIEGRFRPRDLVSRSFCLRQTPQRNKLELCSLFLEQFHSALEDRFDCLVDHIEKEFLGDSEGEGAFRRDLAETLFVFCANEDGIEYQRQIADRAGERANEIERDRERNYPAGFDTA